MIENDQYDIYSQNSLIVMERSETGFSKLSEREVMELYWDGHIKNENSVANNGWELGHRATDGAFRLTEQGNTHRMTVLPGGNVWIWTATPTTNLALKDNLHQVLLSN